MLKLVLLVLCALVATNAQGTSNREGDLDSVLTDIFGTPPGPGSSPNGELNQPNTGNVGGLDINDIFTSPPPDGGFTEPPNRIPSIPPNNEFPTPPPNSGFSTVATVDPGNILEEKPCLTEDKQNGVCVPYYLCHINNTINTDGTDIIDIRVGDGPCSSYLQSCCLPPDVSPTPPPPPVQREGCGWRNPDGVGLKTKGDNDNESKYAEFPWMVAILKIEPVNANDPNGQRLNVYVGGGSLIHPSVVLTAAHYVANAKSPLRARAGEWDTQTKNEIYPYQDRDVQDVVIHKDFRPGPLFYDVALLFLVSPMNPAPNVATVCLPPPRQRVDGGTRCFASGWGKDLFGKEGRYQVILKKVEVPVVERNSCQTALRKTRLGTRFMLHSSFMCAGGEVGKDTCRGDGGSPLVCPIEDEEGRYVQSGIVAWGIGCGEDGTPGVYVDVSNLREWIDDKIVGRGLDIKTYRYDI